MKKGNMKSENIETNRTNNMYTITSAFFLSILYFICNLQVSVIQFKVKDINIYIYFFKCKYVFLYIITYLYVNEEQNSLFRYRLNDISLFSKFYFDLIIS